MKRIKLSEIKEHPWFRVDVPGYLECMLSKKYLRELCSGERKGERGRSHYIGTVDPEIVSKLFEVLTLLINTLDELESKSLKLRRDKSLH